MVDRTITFAWDQEIFGEAELEQPPAKSQGVITDDTRPHALLPHSAHSDGHDSQRISSQPVAPENSSALPPDKVEFLAHQMRHFLHLRSATSRCWCGILH